MNNTDHGLAHSVDKSPGKFLATIVTSWPSSTSNAALVNPMIPAPAMATFFPLEPISKTVVEYTDDEDV